MAKNMGDVVVNLLQKKVKDAQDALRLGRDNKSPNLKDLEQAVEDARKQLSKYTDSRGSDRKRLTDKFLDDYYDNMGDWVADLVKQFPDLINLFNKAVQNNWSTDEFIGEIYKSKWWKEQEDKGRGNTWLDTFIMENDPSQQGKWIDAIDDVKQKIRDAAKGIYDMEVSEADLDKIARRYLYQGWDKNDQRGLKVWLARQFGKPVDEGGATRAPGGQVLDVERQLRNAARNYGVNRYGNWFSDTAKKVLDPNSKYTEDDAWNELIREAAGLYPSLADRLSKETSVRDLANGYIGQLARYLEINDPDLVELDDPLLQKAFTNLDPNTSKPALMPLWQFTQEIKKDARWQYTSNALNTYSQIGSDLGRMMGFVG